MKRDIRDESYDLCVRVALYLFYSYRFVLSSAVNNSDVFMQSSHQSIFMLSGDLPGVLERCAGVRERERDRLGEREI